MNRNYLSDQVCVSGRASSSQSDAMATGQYFSSRKNLGISAHYNYMSQDKSTIQTAGIGLSYHLIFFNEISTGWGIGINYNDLATQSDSGNIFRIYNETWPSSLKRSTYASVNFGWLINYENIMAGVSFQPAKLVYFTSSPKGTFYTTGSLYIKYRYPLTRTLSATLWYHANLNNMHNLQLVNTEIMQLNMQSHAFHVHIAGKKGLIGGIGCRITNFSYTSVISKVGYNFRHLQLVYGIEPYWLQMKYSEIIHELSLTYKLN
jgi:hypothetical protein